MEVEGGRVGVEWVVTYLPRHVLACLVKEEGPHWAAYVCQAMRVVYQLSRLTLTFRAVYRLWVATEEQRKCFLDLLLYVMVHKHLGCSTVLLTPIALLLDCAAL